MTKNTEEIIMARTGTPLSKPADPASEPEVDYLADPAPARPYGDAVTESHREMLATAGIVVPEKSE